MENSINPVLKHPNKIFGVLKRKKFLFCTTAIMIAALVSFYMLWGAQKTEANYITDTVKKGSVTNTIPATGTIEPVSTVSLSFENAEIIKKIFVKVGDHVTTGQLLAEQEGDSLQLQMIQNSASLKGAVAKLELIKKGSKAEDIAQSEANLSMAQSAYDLAKSKLESNQKLFDEGVISQFDLDTVKNEYASAEGKLKQAEEALKSLRNGNRQEDIDAQAAEVESSNARLQIAQKDLAGIKMVSPMDGIVSEVNGGEGQRATANNNSTSGGSSGFMVVISEALQVNAQVNEADIGKLEVGQKAELTVNSFPNKTFTGKVISISPQATTISNVQVYDTVIQLDEEQQGLKAGMPTNVNIIISRHQNTLTIAKGAVTYATSYLSKMGQNVPVKPKSPDSKDTNGSTGSTGSSKINAGTNEGSTNSSKSGGGSNDSSVSRNLAPGSEIENIQKQQANVLVLDKSSKPVPRQVVLGLSDQKNYEVLEGLNDGDMVVVGESGDASTSSSTTSKSNNIGGIMGGGGPPPSR